MDKIYTKEGFKEDLTSKLTHIMGVMPEEATDEQYYKAIAIMCKDRLAQNWFDFRHKVHQSSDAKTVYYMCMEFLLGRSLKNNLYNMNLTSVAEEALADFGISLDNLYECEPDAGLGNGGLGRLAACYLDALATGGYSAMGYGILYEYGIFKQKIVDGWQTELPDFWLPGGDVWLAPHSDEAVNVSFGGELKSGWQDGYYVSEVLNASSVIAIPYDMYISGKDRKSVSVLRLWKAEAPGLDMKLFNDGDYTRAIEKQATAEAICKVLYPADNHPEGKMLRLRQQYFLVSASIQDIVKRHLRHYKGIESIPQKMAIHINDTHPTLAIPELMRICMDECGYSWDDAWKIVSQTFAYTNHTVMKEALECWPEDIFRLLLPRIYQIVVEIDRRYRTFIWDVTHDAGRVEDMAIISNGVIRMANLCVATCHSVNGVSALHSEILKKTIFSNFYNITPNKFKNVTNGIAYRRWLCQANPELTDFITELIGPEFIHDAMQLEKLKDYTDDKQVLARIGEIKQHNKDNFCKFIKEDQGIILNPNSLFDVQVKRLHEYKRQHLNVYEIIHNYLMLKDNPNMDFQPRTYIFGSKAASGYFMAKKIISLIVNLAQVVNNDPDVRDRIKIAFIEDYRVSMAEHLMPAADISEQISLAGTEASGTGNMKLMINGAVTLGTMDGANVEIHDAVGPDNIFIFGMNAAEVEELKQHYDPNSYFMNNDDIKRVVEFINHGVNGNYFPELAGQLINNDPYMVLADYADYQRVRENMVDLYAKDQERWNRMALIQTASAGIFSADRAIAEYAKNIWHAEPIE
ncbi:MAG: glycogen/starch/alpha-glucan phosphorylase [Oscillospiraceae bacterium]|nr:glycogen/starch/alpha-glucan phosphorylase [Oscillospiraceae bacterium]